MTRPRRAEARWQHRDRADALILLSGVGAGALMMLVAWAPTVDVPAPMPAAQASSPGPLISSQAEPDPAQPDPAQPDPALTEREQVNLPAETTTAAEAAAGQSAGGLEVANLLSIPALGIRAAIDPVTVVDDALSIPDDPTRVGRWTGGAGLDDPQGAVLISGHVAWQGKRGALWGLAAAEPGSIVVVTDPAAKPSAWRVTRVWAVPRDTSLPELFRTSGPKRLALVTCGGSVVAGSYTHNVIVEASPAPAL